MLNFGARSGQVQDRKGFSGWSLTKGQLFRTPSLAAHTWNMETANPFQPKGSVNCPQSAENKGSLRFTLTLDDSNDKNFPEFSYSELVKGAAVSLTHPNQFSFRFLEWVSLPRSENLLR